MYVNGAESDAWLDGLKGAGEEGKALNFAGANLIVGYVDVDESHYKEFS